MCEIFGFVLFELGSSVGEGVEAGLRLVKSTSTFLLRTHGRDFERG